MEIPQKPVPARKYYTRKPKTDTQANLPTKRPVAKTENNYAFIDCQNIWVNKDRSWQLDWAKFRDYLGESLSVKRAYLFIGFVAGYQKMYQQMQEAGFILLFKPVQEINGKKICNIDTEMVLQTMIQLPNFDKGVIVTGDGDFTCLVDHLRVIDKLKMLILPDHSYSLSLEKCAREKVEFIGSLSPQIAKTKITEDDIPTALIISD
jgi:uncharacterized LabA/DUF88 family protein